MPVLVLCWCVCICIYEVWSLLGQGKVLYDMKKNDVVGEEIQPSVAKFIFFIPCFLVGVLNYAHFTHICTHTHRQGNIYRGSIEQQLACPVLDHAYFAVLTWPSPEQRGSAPQAGRLNQGHPACQSVGTHLLCIGDQEGGPLQ